jgi:hypothetical protein
MASIKIQYERGAGFEVEADTPVEVSALALVALAVLWPTSDRAPVETEIARLSK